MFWLLNEHVAKIAGVDYNKFVTFHAKDNPILDSGARERLYQSYQVPRLHRHMNFYPGAEEFEVLAPVMPRIRYYSNPEEACAMARVLLDRAFGPLP